MSVLKVEHLAKSYKTRKVITDLSLEVTSGETVGLLGPNGAGKTTAFYMIVGLVAADAGSIHLDDQDLTTLPMHRRARAGVGYLPQEASIFRKLSVEDNVLAILETRDDLDSAARHARLDEILAELRIDHVRKSLGISLSGGERQRLKLAVQMGNSGGIYVLDEPTAGLHLADVEQLQGLLDRLVDSGKSVIVIEHHQAVMAHADWIIDLGPGAGHDGGRLVFEGTPSDLVANPSTLTGEHLAAYVGA